MPSAVTICVACAGYHAASGGAIGASKGWLGWGTMALGLAGWVLLAAGLGKLLSWPVLMAAASRDGLVPGRLRRPLTVVLAALEVMAGAMVLLAPSRRLLVAVAILLTLIAWYESERFRRGEPDAMKFGRLRRVYLSPGVVVMDAVLAGGLLATATGWSVGVPSERLITGAVLCALYVLVIGLWPWRPSPERTLEAETIYLRERAAGQTEAQARAQLASELHLTVDETYLLLPALDAWWLRTRRAQTSGVAEQATNR